jgi:hypothetical protein
VRQLGRRRRDAQRQPHQLLHAEILRAVPGAADHHLGLSALSNGFGQFPIKLRIAHLEGIQWEYESIQTTMFLDRLAEVRYWRRLRDIRFPAPGAYAFSLLIDEDVLADTKIQLAARGH